MWRPEYSSLDSFPSHCGLPQFPPFVLQRTSVVIAFSLLSFSQFLHQQHQSGKQLEEATQPQGMQCKPIQLETLFQKKTGSTLSGLFGLWAESEMKMISMFLFFIHFVDRFLQDLFVDSGIFCLAVSWLECSFLREWTDSWGVRPEDAMN